MPIRDYFTVDMEGEADKKLRQWAIQLVHKKVGSVTFAEMEKEADFLIKYVKEGKRQR